MVGENAHQRGLARAVGTEQPQYPGTQFQAESAQGPNRAAIALADVVDGELQGRFPFDRWFEGTECSLIAVEATAKGESRGSNSNIVAW